MPPVLLPEIVLPFRKSVPKLLIPPPERPPLKGTAISFEARGLPFCIAIFWPNILFAMVLSLIDVFVSEAKVIPPDSISPLLSSMTLLEIDPPALIRMPPVPVPML